MSNKKIKISDNIRMIRENLNYSQEYVAAKLDISQQAYSLIEKQPEKTSFKNLKLIATILHVNVSTLILEDEQFIQQNFNQQNCNIASLQNISSNELYEKFISKLENEIIRLKSELENNKIIILKEEEC